MTWFTLRVVQQSFAQLLQKALALLCLAIVANLLVVIFIPARGFAHSDHAGGLTTAEAVSASVRGLQTPVPPARQNSPPALTFTAASKDTAPQEKADSDPCTGLQKIDGFSDRCTHGPDTPPPGFDIRRDVQPLIMAAGSEAPKAVCVGDGVSGNRVQVLYVRASDRPSRYDSYLESFRQWAAEADLIYLDSATKTGGERRIRFVHDTQCTISVLNVVVPPEGDDSFGNTIAALQKLNYNRTDRKYVVFMETNKICGVGDILADDRIGQENQNNIGPSYARIDAGCWGGRIVAHELMHTLGGLQLTAPNTTGGYHCTDEYDILCYSDPPNYPSMRIVCPDTMSDSLFDCNNDDYYHTNPPAGSYLSTHWNTANSQFLIGANPPTPTPTFTPTATPTPLPGCDIYESTSPPLAIPDSSFIQATLQIPDDVMIADLDLVNLQIQHVFVGDLEAYLTNPNGVRVHLFSKVGREGNDFMGTVFDDAAASSIKVGVAPFSGRFRPIEPLAIFNGQRSLGSWQLQISDTSAGDTGTLLAWGLEVCSNAAPNAQFSPTATPTPTVVGTPTLTPPPVPGGLTLQLDVQPPSIQDFRFEGDLGAFTLDDADPNDGDDVGQSLRRSLLPGVYRISEAIPNTWHLTEIRCTPADAARVELSAGRLMVTIGNQQEVTCTFVNQRGVTIRTRQYADNDGDGARSSNEPWLANRVITIYTPQGVLLQRHVTNEFGKANFNYLRAAEYAICETPVDGWANTQPGVLAAGFTVPCYQTRLSPGQLIYARFGDQPIGGNVAAQAQAPQQDGLVVSAIPDVSEDDEGYNPAILVDTDASLSDDSANAGDEKYRIYLAIVTK
jgi:subtilisin-like proprotein convertase family protein